MLLRQSSSDVSSALPRTDKPLSVAHVVAIIRDRGWRVSKRPALALLGFGDYSVGYRVTAVTPEHIEYMGGFTVMVHWENGPPSSSYRGLYELQSLQRQLEKIGYEVDFPGHVLYAKRIASATSVAFRIQTTSGARATQHAKTT